MTAGCTWWVTPPAFEPVRRDRKSTRLNSSHLVISYAVFCLKKKKEYRCQSDRCSYTHDVTAGRAGTEQQLVGADPVYHARAEFALGVHEPGWNQISHPLAPL